MILQKKNLETRPYASRDTYGKSNQDASCEERHTIGRRRGLNYSSNNNTSGAPDRLCMPLRPATTSSSKQHHGSHTGSISPELDHRLEWSPLLVQTKKKSARAQNRVHVENVWAPVQIPESNLICRFGFHKELRGISPSTLHVRHHVCISCLGNTKQPACINPIMWKAHEKLSTNKATTYIILCCRAES